MVEVAVLTSSPSMYIGEGATETVNEGLAQVTMTITLAWWVGSPVEAVGIASMKTVNVVEPPAGGHVIPAGKLTLSMALSGLWKVSRARSDGAMFAINPGEDVSCKVALKPP